MCKEHRLSAGASIEYGDARFLFPVEDLNATVHQNRDAHLALESVERTAVIVVSPTSLATSYFLGDQPLTAIPVDTLSTAIQTRLAAELADPLDAYELIQIGKRIDGHPNHSLTEFTTS